MATPQEVAKMLADRHVPNEVEDDEAPIVEEPDEQEEHDALDEGDEEVSDPTGDGDQEDDGEDDEEAAGEAGSEHIEYLDVEENLHVKMRVDGEETEVPLSDLIQSYAGEKAAVKRLHEASDLRKKAQADYDQTISEAQQIREAAVAIVKRLDEQLHTPAVSKPDENLKRSNPQRYLQQMDAYDQDQARIAQSRDMLHKAFKEHGDITSKHLEARKAQNAKAIIDAIPALQTEKTKQATMEKIFTAGKAYGFSDEEINSLEDPRMYVMAYDAMLYREQTELGKSKPVEVKGKKKVLRAGKTRKSLTANKVQRQVRTAKDRASKSGKPQDVAEFLVARTLNQRK